MVTKVSNGWLHDGVGHRRDRKTGLYPVYPLPRWSTFCSYHRNPFGSYDDIYHYMRFCQDNYQTARLDITGDEIANTMCDLYKTNSNDELAKFNTEYNYEFDSWSAIYIRLKEVKKEEMIAALT